jgi:hypothetical protein
LASSPRRELLHRSSWIAHNDGIRFDILDDHGTHSHHGSFADAESLADARSSADLDAGTDPDIPGNSNERRKGHEVADAYIVPDRAVEIPDEVHANRGRHRRSNAGDDHRPGRDVNGRVASPFNIDRGEPRIEPLKARGKKPPSPGGSDSDHAVHFGTALIEGPQDGPAFSGSEPLCPIIKKSRNSKR